MENQSVEGKYDGSEMDGVNSPVSIMIVVFLGLTVVGFLYASLWALLLTP